MSLPEPEVLLTEYGELVNIRPMKMDKTPDERKYREGKLCGNLCSLHDQRQLFSACNNENAEHKQKLFLSI